MYIIDPCNYGYCNTHTHVKCNSPANTPMQVVHPMVGPQESGYRVERLLISTTNLSPREENQIDCKVVCPQQDWICFARDWAQDSFLNVFIRKNHPIAWYQPFAEMVRGKSWSSRVDFPAMFAVTRRMLQSYHT